MSQSSEDEKDILKENIKCIICQTFPKDAHETNCCGQIICKSCLDNYKRKICPNCRKNGFKVAPSIIVDQITQSLEEKCIYCYKKIKCSLILAHKYECPNASFICSINKCGFTGNRKKFVDHVISKHPDEVLTLAKYFNEYKERIDPMLKK